MEKFARQAVAEGVGSAANLHVSKDSELYRILVLHYNRNNRIEVRMDGILISLKRCLQCR